MTNVLLLDPLNRGAEALLADHFAVTPVDDPWVALQHVQERHYDALVVETNGLDALDWFLEKLEQLDPELPGHAVVLSKALADPMLRSVQSQWDVLVLPRTIQGSQLKRAVAVQQRPRPRAA